MCGCIYASIYAGIWDSKTGCLPPDFPLSLILAMMDGLGCVSGCGRGCVWACAWVWVWVWVRVGVDLGERRMVGVFEI